MSASIAIDITNVNTISFTPDKNSRASYSDYEIYKGFLGNVSAPFGVKVCSGNYSSGTNTIDVSDLSGVHTFVIQGSSNNGGGGIIVVDLKCS